MDSTCDTTARGSRAVEEYLEHYGIKGQKWGVRRSRAELASQSPKSLTNEELQKAVERMRLEQQFAELSAKQQTVHRGREFVKKLLIDIGETEVTRLSKGAAAVGVEKLLENVAKNDPRFASLNEVSTRIKPKKKK